MPKAREQARTTGRLHSGLFSPFPNCKRNSSFSNICLQFILDFLNNIHICKQQDVGFSPNPQFLTSVCSHTLARTAICFLVAKPCPALLYSMDGCTLDSPWDFPSKGTGVGCHFLLHQIRFLKIYSMYILELPR